MQNVAVAAVGPNVEVRGFPLLVQEKQLEQIHRLTEEAKKSQSALAGFARAVLSRLGRGATTQDVEDVLADAYLAAATRLRNDTDLQVENMGGWFRRVILLTCLEHHRRELREQRQFASQLQDEDDSLDLIANERPVSELRAALQQALARLPDADRRIVEMAASGHTSNEIAAAIGNGTTAEAVRKQKSRVLAALQKLLGGIQVWTR